MGNLSEYIPTDSQTVEAIYAHHKAKGDAEGDRGYLGASIIGHQCGRNLWYGFRHCGQESFDGRMYRLFETGDLAEDRFLAELKAIGCEVYGTDPQTGRQFGFTALAGHFGGHMESLEDEYYDIIKRPSIKVTNAINKEAEKIKNMNLLHRLVEETQRVLGRGRR